MNPRVLLAVVLSAATIASGRHTLTVDQQQTVDEWIANNPAFRPAVDEDCECEKSLNDVRTGAGAGDQRVPDYSPYRVAGDFNKDGLEDFAVVVLRRTNPETGFAFLIFNRGANGAYSLAYERRGYDLRGQGLFFGVPEREERLMLGPFYRPKIWFIPKGATYDVPMPSL